jgi:hypothetical protein
MDTRASDSKVDGEGSGKTLLGRSSGTTLLSEMGWQAGERVGNLFLGSPGRVWVLLLGQAGAAQPNSCCR